MAVGWLFGSSYVRSQPSSSMCQRTRWTKKWNATNAKKREIRRRRQNRCSVRKPETPGKSTTSFRIVAGYGFPGVSGLNGMADQFWGEFWYEPELCASYFYDRSNHSCNAVADMEVAITEPAPPKMSVRPIPRFRVTNCFSRVFPALQLSLLCSKKRLWNEWSSFLREVSSSDFDLWWWPQYTHTYGHVTLVVKTRFLSSF